jgi:hypothetical protein
MLLDFRELTGEHSGENMCNVIWGTLEMYGLKDKVLERIMKRSGFTHSLFVDTSYQP